MKKEKKKKNMLNLFGSKDLNLYQKRRGGRKILPFANAVLVKQTCSSSKLM